AVWRADAAIGQHRHLGLRERLVLADDAVAAAPPPRSAAARPDRVLAHPHRQIVLDGLDRRVPGVAHVRVHAADPFAAGWRAHPAADHLVVGERPAPPGTAAAERDV